MKALKRYEKKGKYLPEDSSFLSLYSLSQTLVAPVQGSPLSTSHTQSEYTD